jgi:hypothetical protein
VDAFVFCIWMCVRQVFFRLNEMDDLMHATAHGTSAHADLKAHSALLMQSVSA